MRTIFFVLATSVTIFATGVNPVAASEYEYCLQGVDYAGAGDCQFASCAMSGFRIGSHGLLRSQPFISRWPILISRTPPSGHFLPSRVVAEAR
jgi:hypothetical protein